MPKRVGKVEAVKALERQNKALLAQETPTPSGEPHRISAPTRKVSDILEDMAALSEDDLGLLFWSIDQGMWDEWDTSLEGGLAMFGETEMKIAVKSAVYAAKAVENNKENSNDN